MTWVNVGCGPHRAPSPWVNVDCHEGDGITPDIVADPADPLAGWADGTVERVYLGHVLEHVPWPDVPGFLDRARRALAPGGLVCAVGPDVHRVITRWRDGLDPEGWDLVVSALEGPWDRDYSGSGCDLIEREASWPGARHWWNCEEQRMVQAFEQAGFAEVRAVAIDPAALAGWPVVSFTQWQCAVTARAA